MEVVVPTSSFPADEDDWRGRFVLDLSRALRDRGHRLVHVVPDPAGRDELVGLESGIELRRLAFGPRFARGLVMGQGIGANLKRAPWRLAGLPGLMRALARGLEVELDRRPEAVVLAHWVLPAGLAAARLKRHRRFRQVTVVHGGALQNLLAIPGGGRLLAGWAAGCDAALYVSEDLRRRARARLGHRAPLDAVSPMGVVPGRFGPRRRRREARRELGLAEEGLLVLGVGRLLRLKGFDLLVEALVARPDAKLVILGEGPEAARLAQRARALGVALLLPGAVGPARLGLHYDAADCLVVPSRLGPGGRSEGTPVVALEALARGLPVVGSATGGLTELLVDRPRCALFRGGDHLELGRILAAMSTRPDDAAGEEVTIGRRAEPWDYAAIAALVENLLAGGGKT